MSARSGIVVVLALAAALPLSLGLGRAQGDDLKTEPTVKGEPTTKGTELTTGSTTLTPTPTGPKTGKPQPTATAAPTESAAPSASVSAEPSASAPEPAPSEEPPKKPAQRSFARKKIPLAVGDLEVSLSMPDNWAELPEAALPEVENTEQVTVVTRKGFGVHDPKGKPPAVEEVIVVCGKASGDYWADAIRDAAFTQMIAAVEKEASQYTTLKSIEPDGVREDNDRLLQSFATDADFSVDGKAVPSQLGKGKPKVANTVKLQGLNFIAFTQEGEGKPPTLVACSVACAHLVAEGDAALCPAAIGSIEFSGTYAKAPKRSWLAELLFKLKSDPTTMWLGIVGAGFLMLVLVLVLVLVLRKKKPADAHDDHDDEDYAHGYEAGLAAAEIKSMHASPPPPEGFFDPQTLTRKKI